MSFTIKAEYHSIVCIDLILFTHSFVDGHLGCFYLLTIVNSLLWTLVYMYLFKSLFSILLGIYLGMELLDHMEILSVYFTS